ncbi:methyltransferase domain-containing protein [Haloimpatiens lingqiaonensis]|uniref:methyltransferase domain-containing protein n=1 Tax=Haloimpatiens lingqiaonensis TaxID=1380675 RepID=UPI0010FDB701|nr:methyltransferase domain-containing protein [Haloimpatiens lingqiaonensis]
MFTEHDYVIWGDYCSCGSECYILQNKFHPWDEVDFSIKIQCKNCGKTIEVDKNKAEKFYNKKIFSYFEDVKGTVIDLGCGGGLLSKLLLNNEKVTKIYAIDNDMGCKKYIDELNGGDKITFLHMDISGLGEYFKEGQVDYIVSRDVFMFIRDTEKYFNDINKIVSKGIKQMGWYISDNKRMKNKLFPEQIVKELTAKNWQVDLECLEWYKSGYFIRGFKCLTL